MLVLVGADSSFRTLDPDPAMALPELSSPVQLVNVQLETPLSNDGFGISLRVTDHDCLSIHALTGWQMLSLWLSAKAGTRFREEVLSRGGSRPAMESFVAFRGRPPQLDALLRHNGMVTPA